MLVNLHCDNLAGASRRCGLESASYRKWCTGSYCMSTICSYHGIAEIDLTCLTSSCLGYELWEFSTDCTLVLKSVKATGIILLLGIGSFVCYRLYHRYRRKGSHSPDRQDGEENRTSPSSDNDGTAGWWLRRPSHRRRRSSHLIRKWVSKELIDSQTEDTDDIKGEYFGPRDPVETDDKGLRRFTRTAPDCWRTTGYRVPDWKFRVVNRHGMGQCSSLSNPVRDQDKPVYYNSLGLHMPVPHRNHRPPPDTNDRAPISSTWCPTRPNTLPLRCPSRHKGGHQHIPHNHSSKPTSDSRVTAKDEEGGIEGDDEEGDEVSIGSAPLLSQSEDEQSASMLANFSPRSLLNRCISLASSPRDVFIASGNGGQSFLPEDIMWTSEVDNLICLPRTKFLLQSPSSSSESELLEPRAASSILNTSSGLQRDVSFGSEFSEMSVDLSVFNDIGVTTQAKIDSIQLEIDSVKREIESYILENVNVEGPTPAAFTKLVKRSVSDASEYSSDDVTSDSKAIGYVQPKGQQEVSIAMKKRQEFAKIQSPMQTVEQRSSSCGTVLDGPILTSDVKVVANSSSHSVNVSLEWESMLCPGTNCGSTDGTETSLDLCQQCLVPSMSNFSHVGDSGSDFGTPLTNGSPELCQTKQAGSVASLEWDYPEFETTPETVGPIHRLSCNNSTAIAEVPAQRTMMKSSSMSSAFLMSSSIEHKMWSSMESGYVDEFSSNQVSPQSNVCAANDPSVTTKKQHNLDVQDPAKSTPVVDDAGKAEQLRTWPVIGPKTSMTIGFGQMGSRVRKEFFTACKHLGFGHVRAIHDDHYGALRAVLVQALIQGFFILEHSGGVDHIKKKLGFWMRSRSRSWIRKWNFAGRIEHVTRENCLDKMFRCLEALNWLIGCVLNSQNRERAAIDAFNSDTALDVQTMEGVKLLLLASAIDLHKAMTMGQDVPAFATLLFARETSLTPEAFLVNHLNSIGYTCGPGHMEKHMLAYSLGLTICVLNPITEGKRDEFITYYPKHKLGSRHEIYLVSTDGQRFSSVVK